MMYLRLSSVSAFNNRQQLIENLMRSNVLSDFTEINHLRETLRHWRMAVALAKSNDSYFVRTVGKYFKQSFYELSYIEFGDCGFNDTSIACLICETSKTQRTAQTILEVLEKLQKASLLSLEEMVYVFNTADSLLDEYFRYIVTKVERSAKVC